jgi:hypothetical protein
MKLPVSFSETLYCSLCHSDDLVRSRRREILDFVLLVVLLRPFRCMECGSRTYAPVFAKRAASGSEAKMPGELYGR